MQVTQEDKPMQSFKQWQGRGPGTGLLYIVGRKGMRKAGWKKSKDEFTFGAVYGKVAIQWGYWVAREKERTRGAVSSQGATENWQSVQWDQL